MVGMSVSPIAQTGLLHHPSVTVAIVEWEVILAASLALGVRPALVRYLAQTTFLSFAAASGYAYLVGSASCGCFGAVQVNPLYVCLFDVGVVAAFAVCRPGPAPNPRLHRASFLRPVIGGTALALVILGAMSLVYQDPAIAIARLRGKTVAVTPLVLDLGRQPGGTEVYGSVKVSNFSNVPVRIAGGTSDCSCILTEKLPWTLQPGEEVELPVRVKLPKAAGAFHREAYLWTDTQERKLTFEITGVMAE